ncbi:MAG: T9SS type A sorting domain-containing protein, partial [Bacteroidota bacterium]
HRPDELGPDCMVEQKAIQTPNFYFRGTPIYPKYRMRRLGDTTSICDHVTETIFVNTFEPEPAAAEQLLLYPNPVGPVARLLFTESLAEVQWTIFDLQGRSLGQGRRDFLPAQQALSLSTDFLQPGMYLLQIRTGDGRFWTRRLMKE